MFKRIGIIVLLMSCGLVSCSQGCNQGEVTAEERLSIEESYTPEETLATEDYFTDEFVTEYNQLMEKYSAALESYQSEEDFTNAKILREKMKELDEIQRELYDLQEEAGAFSDMSKEEIEIIREIGSLGTYFDEMSDEELVITAEFGKPYDARPLPYMRCTGCGATGYFSSGNCCYCGSPMIVVNY